MKRSHGGNPPTIRQLTRWSMFLTPIVMVTTQAGCGLPTATWLELLPVSLTTGGLDIEMEFDRPYVTRREGALLMDVFRPRQTEGARPAVVLIHPGYWTQGDRWLMHDWAADLASQGYVAASIQHRFMTDPGLYPGTILDALTAVAHLREHAAELSVDPERIGLFGVSSGGYIALMAGMIEDLKDLRAPVDNTPLSRARVVVSISAPTDFTVNQSKALDWQLNIIAYLLGATRARNPERWAAASPVNHVRRDGPAVFIYHGAVDDIVPVEQARALQAALASVNQPHVYVEDPAAAHLGGSFWVSGSAQSFRSQMLAFLAEHL